MKKSIVIFRAKGPIKNLALEKEFIKNNFKTITFPILKIISIKSSDINLNLTQAVLVTSLFGLHYFSNIVKNRKIRLFILGETTKKLAIKLGYTNIIDCEGDSVKMLEVIKKSVRKGEGELIYAGAKKISLDLPSLLTSIGYKVNRLILYESTYINKFNKIFLELLKNDQISWIVLLSSKGAKNFMRLSKLNIDKKKLALVKFCCLSSNISDELKIENINKFFPKKPKIKNIIDLIINHEVKNG